METVSSYESEFLPAENSLSSTTYAPISGGGENAALPQTVPIHKTMYDINNIIKTDATSSLVFLSAAKKKSRNRKKIKIDANSVMTTAGMISHAIYISSKGKIICRSPTVNRNIIAMPTRMTILPCDGMSRALYLSQTAIEYNANTVCTRTQTNSQ